jgi:hypothetical protein
MAIIEHRTGPELIYAIADHVRAGRPIDEAIQWALIGEGNDRYTNLIADLADSLHLEPLSHWDVDKFADADAVDPEFQKDHPGAFVTRLVLWAETIHSPAAVAATLDTLATNMDRALAAAPAEDGAA